MAPTVAAPKAVSHPAARTAARTPIKADAGNGKPPVGAAPVVQIAPGAAVPAGTTTVGSVLQVVVETTPPTPVVDAPLRAAAIAPTTTTTTCTTVADPANGDPAGSSVCDDPAVLIVPNARITVTQLSAPANLVPDPNPQTVEMTCSDTGIFACNPPQTLTFLDTGTPPMAHDDADTVPITVPTVLDVLANDDAGAAGTATISAVTQPQHGAVTVVPAPSAALAYAVTGPRQTIRYTPTAGYAGPDVFTYTISTPNGTSTGTVHLTVVGPTPTAAPDTATTTSGRAVTVDVLANDSSHGGGPLTLTAVGRPAHGSARIVNGTVVYTPDQGFVGTDAVAYTVSTRYGKANGTVTVRVDAAPVVHRPQSQHDSLAATGVPAEALLDGGLALLAAGTVTTAVGRRRRRGRHAG